VVGRKRAVRSRSRILGFVRERRTAAKGVGGCWLYAVASGGGQARAGWGRGEEGGGWELGPASKMSVLHQQKRDWRCGRKGGLEGLNGGELTERRFRLSSR
jgi:hypothetical protein